jgi:hypothetical protein
VSGILFGGLVVLGEWLPFKNDIEAWLYKYLELIISVGVKFVHVLLMLVYHRERNNMDLVDTSLPVGREDSLRSLELMFLSLCVIYD